MYLIEYKDGSNPGMNRFNYSDMITLVCGDKDICLYKLIRIT